MAAPTFVAEYPTAFNNTTSPKTAMNAVAINSGDVLVGVCADEGDENIGITENGSASWTERHASVGQAASEGHTYIATSPENLTVTFTAAGYFGGNVIRFSGSDGIGNTASAESGSGTPTVNLTTTQANSAIVVICSDWNANGGTQTFTLGGSSSGWTALTDYPGDGAHYGVGIAYYADAGAAGSKTITMSAPTGQSWGIIAIEVLGTAGGGTSAVPAMMHSYRLRRN